MLIEKYNRNGVVYDFSCGWGSRMLGTIRNGVKYCGTDPNYLLVDRLKQMAADYASTTHSSVDIDIRTQGSERLVAAWGGELALHLAALRTSTRKITSSRLMALRAQPVVIYTPASITEAAAQSSLIRL